MNKREERELFFKSIFMTEFLADGESLADPVVNYLTSIEKGDLIETIMGRINCLYSHIMEIDETINGLADGWKTSRMSKVDLALLRMSIFEMRYENLDKGISINEAVELAKEYGGERSFAFINGILGNVGE